jgi:dienelactone hydrolase
VLDRVVLRGEGKKWRDAKLKVEYFDTTRADGYRLRKLRYEAVPGLWIPALLYVPDPLPDKAPVALAVNGHDRLGKAAKYKQVRSINLAKRGLIVLNVEWFGMGQLRVAGNQHGCMNQIDLCGTSGLAPFYLAMTRGLDVLLAQPKADPKRVCVSGLSGGGWQTIVVSALDPRVILANPVAGYSNFRVRLRDHFKDLCDSEQTPVDLATLADYTHLTALRAPRPTLLTYNSKDECCFEAGYALPPLVEAARPVYRLLGKPKALRSHVNHDPGTHNFEKDNREALYRMVGDHFYPGDDRYSGKEIACDKELKSADDLEVKLPKDNATFNSLARGLMTALPRHGKLPATAKGAAAWQAARRKELREVLRCSEMKGEGKEATRGELRGTAFTLWKLKLAGRWSVGVVELTRGKPAKTTLLVHDSGRKEAAAEAERLLKAGHRVLAVDLFYFGEAKLEQKDWLFALLVSAVGDRPLGLQASQLAAVARWANGKYKQAPEVRAVGPRTSLIALCAATIEEKAITGLSLSGCRASLKEVLAANKTVNHEPETFCFGLLEVADVKQLAALYAPRPVRFVDPNKRLKEEMADLKGWYGTLGKAFSPLP